MAGFAREASRRHKRENSQNSASLNRRREANDGKPATTTELDGAEETGSDGASFNMNLCVLNGQIVTFCAVS